MAAEIKLLTVKEVAKKLAVAPSTIYEWKDKGLIPATYLPGKCVRFIESTIDEWLLKQQVVFNHPKIKTT